MNLYLLHGFLGLPSDFERTMREIETPSEESHVLSVDYLKFRETSSQVALTDWGKQFNRWVESYEKGKSSGKRVLVGYSQGGRLALHAVQANPSFWQGLILISTNLGISNGEKPARLKSDQEWAQKFLNENFVKTVEKWNAQPVFQGSKAEPQRNETQYNRNLLVSCLENWSLAHQQDFKQEIPNWKMPTMYVAGDKDAKYIQIAREFQRLQPSANLSIVPESGHRVLFDQPEALAKLISDFIK